MRRDTEWRAGAEAGLTCIIVGLLLHPQPFLQLRRLLVRSQLGLRLVDISAPSSLFFLLSEPLAPFRADARRWSGHEPGDASASRRLLARAWARCSRLASSGIPVPKDAHLGCHDGRSAAQNPRTSPAARHGLGGCAGPAYLCSLTRSPATLFWHKNAGRRSRWSVHLRANLSRI